MLKNGKRAESSDIEERFLAPLSVGAPVLFAEPERFATRSTSSWAFFRNSMSIFVFCACAAAI